MKILKEKINDSKIYKSEIAFFLCWRNFHFRALADFILDFRKQYPHFLYSNEIIYEKCLKLLQSTNTNRFKISQICGESIDEYIRKMRICGIISLRGNGRFLDFNTFEMPKIEYVIKKYSTFEVFSNKESYFKYMGEIDSHILEITEQADTSNQANLRLQTLEKFASQYTKEQIYRELEILSVKKVNSKDEVLKFIPESVRLEFLTAIALKQHFNSLKIMPNYSIDDEGLPKCHASGNKPDILCEDKESKSIIEVSLICGRAQVNNELLPIARHLKEIIESSIDSNVSLFFALFIAPKIFEDSKRYVKFIKYDENLDIINFDILEFINQLKTYSHKSLPFSESLKRLSWFRKF
ncbi:AlwI family type II restriction endonuclease [Helicobacter sp. MIT 14-3879]|nr:AlwI family type II restriction endonuclease [Helicobacter sp. MIT 14-3879]